MHKFYPYNGTPMTTFLYGYIFNYNISCLDLLAIRCLIKLITWFLKIIFFKIKLINSKVKYITTEVQELFSQSLPAVAGYTEKMCARYSVRTMVRQ